MPDEAAQTADIIEIVDENLREGFAQVPKPVLRARGLSLKAKLVYIALLDYAWQKGSCFPGQSTLAADLDASVDTIYRSLSELRDYGLIAWKRQGLNKTNVYYLLRLSDCPKLTVTRRNPQVAESRNRNLRSQESATLRNKEYSFKNTHTISKYSKAEASVSKAKEAIHAKPKSRGLTSVGTVLAVRRQFSSAQSSGLEPQIGELITSWSAEWGDASHIRSNLTQVRHIQEGSRWSAESLVSVLCEAHATTNQDGQNARNKMAYFFVVLRDLMGASPSAKGRVVAEEFGHGG